MREHPSLLLLPLFFAAALLGNVFHYPLLLGGDFLFGSVAALVVLHFYGVRWAVAVGLVASLWSWRLWNHPFGVLILTAEIVIAGWLVKRRRIDVMLADTVFWFGVGMPAFALASVTALGLDASNTFLVTVNAASNGVFNVLLARLAILILSQLRPFKEAETGRRIRFEEIAFTVLATFILVPSVAVVGTGNRVEETWMRDEIQTRLRSVSRQASGFVGEWISDIVHAAETTAEGLDPMAPALDLQKRLDAFRASETGLVSTALIDANGFVVGYSPTRDPGTGRTYAGTRIKESLFLERLKASERTLLSDVINAKAGPKGAITVAAVPIRVGGVYRGNLAATLSSPLFSQRLEGAMGGWGIRGAILDTDRRTVAESRVDNRDKRADVEHETQAQAEAGTISHVEGGVYRWMPSDPGMASIERIHRSYYYMEGPLGGPTGWILRLEAPVAPFQEEINRRHAIGLAVLLVVWLFSMACAFMVSRRIARAVGELGEVTSGLPWKIARKAPIAWPDSTLEEEATLIENFKSMASTLAANFEEINKANETLEQRVVDRTNALNRANEELSKEIDERRDIEKVLQRSEEHYRLLADNSTDVIGRYSLDLRVEYISPAVRVLMGFEPEEVTGLHVMDLIDPQDHVVVATAQKKIFDNGDATMTVRARRKDGAYLWTESTGRLMQDPETREVLGFVVVTRDVSARKREEEEKERLLAKVQHAQKLESLGVLAGGIAHDFNNLLTGILGHADLAMRTMEPDAPAHRHVERIEKAALRAADMAQQMLAYSGKGKFVVRPIDLSALVHDMSELLAASVSRKCVIDYRLGKGLPTVEADIAQFQQVVMNLIINAAEAMGDDGGTVTVKTDFADVSRIDLDAFYMAHSIQPGRYVRLEVADTGCGMSDEVKARIFDPFFTTKFTGRGLGLSAVLGIIFGHKGTLKVVSRQGEGTSFTVIFPASDLAVELVPEVGSGLEERKGWSGMALVVDDEETVRDLAKAMLSELGFTVVCAEDGIAGVEMVRSTHALLRLVLLDLTMPRMGGEAALVEMKKIRPDLPVILSSGFVLEDEAERLSTEGAGAFVQKPYRLSNLVAAIASALSSSAGPTVR